MMLSHEEYVKTLLVRISNTVRLDESLNWDNIASGYDGSLTEKKAAFDQVFRDVLKTFIDEKPSCTKYRKIITLAIEAANKEICSLVMPFFLLSDTFDTITLEKCEEMFDLVEEHVETWKSPEMFDAGKNYLLRMSNDLLKRLSKSVNTIFCGRIQLFLARLFPLSEKSALNLMSNFNSDNITTYNTNPDDSQFSLSATGQMDTNEVDKKKISSIPIDYNLYRRFWLLQDFFSKPMQLYEKAPWKFFVMNSDVVLKAFDSFKLDDLKSDSKNAKISYKEGKIDDYFAKYLTSEKLFDLQLNDGNFRRYVLIQFLILFQYLNATVRFKSDTQKLTEEQATWTKTSESKVYQLLRETPPDGENFAKAIKHILNREENWNNWKNEGCPSFIQERLTDTKDKAKPKKRSLGDDEYISGSKVRKMGNTELTRLWNLNSDNMAACCSENRVFLPNLPEFFAEAIEQADPVNMVEDQYKLVNNEVFQWKAVRLLSRKSPHFFMQSNQQSLSLSGYLDSMLTKIAKEIPQNVVNEEMKVEEEDELKETQDDDLKQDDEENPNNNGQPANVVTKDCIDAVAEALGSDWKKLATELNFTEDEIEYLESESADISQQAHRLLTVWLDNESDRATSSCLKSALNEVGLSSVIESVWGSDNG